MTSKRRVLFLCTGNSTRSQIAEALLRKQGGEYFEVFSAGSNPQPINPLALAALDHYNVDTTGLRSKSVEEFIGGQPFDFVITLCDKARQECGTIAGAEEFIHWDVADYKSRIESDPVLKTVQELSDRIKMFILLKTKQTPE